MDNRNVICMVALCACAWLMAGSMAANAPAAEIGIEQVIADALEHSYSVKIAAEQVNAANASKRQADSSAYPSLDLDARAAHFWGLKENSIGPSFTIPAIPDRYSSGANLRQPIFTGGRIAGRIDMAGEEVRSARASLAAVRADAVYHVSAAYWTWSKAYYAAESFRAAVAWMETHDRDMRNLRAAGLATENEQLSTSVRLDQTRLRLEEALRHDRLCRAALERMTGRPLAEDASPSRPPEGGPDGAGSERDLIMEALESRPEIKAQQHALNAAQRNVRVQIAGYYPELSATARGEIAKPNQYNVPPEDKWQADAFIGLGLAWNLLDWGLTRGKVNEAKARAGQVAYRLAELREQLAYEVRQALINLENAATKANVARRAEESARLDLKVVTELWQNGLARHADVLDSQSRLTDAGFDLALARAELARALGKSESEGAEEAP